MESLFQIVLLYFISNFIFNPPLYKQYKITDFAVSKISNIFNKLSPLVAIFNDGSAPKKKFE